MFTLSPHRLITAVALAATVAVPSALFAQVEQAKATPPSPVLPETSTASPDLALLATFTKVDRDEIRTARAVLPTLTDAEVKGYAQKLIDDHTAHLAATTAIATRLQVPATRDSTPLPTAAVTTSGTTTVGTATLSTGTTTLGSTTDLQYLTAMIAGHQELLAQLPIDGSMLNDPALGQLLMDTRTTLRTHLNEAVRLKARLTPRTP